MKIDFQITADGSHTLFVPELDEHYHSINGAIQESNHVFIEAGFLKCNQKRVPILEVGFGTGLNALLTALKAKELNKEIHYTALEKYPLSDEIINQLNYTKQHNAASEELFKSIHQAPWGVECKISPHFWLTKMVCDFTQYSLSSDFDLIYFDAFAPEKQPEMWQQAYFNHLYQHTNTEGILTTYCAKGVVRRMLQQAGYTVERLSGPPGKREMLRATKKVCFGEQ